MKSITLCNLKGGSGKSTACLLLASAMGEAGKLVAVRDLDPQGTATKCIRGWEGSKVWEYHSDVEADVTLTDTPPRIDLVGPSLATCDLALIPCGPSPVDAWATRETLKAVKAALPKGGKIRLLFVGVVHGSILARGLPDLADKIGARALKAVVSRRQVYQHFMLTGWRALDRAAKDEIFSVALEVLNVIR